MAIELDTVFDVSAERDRGRIKSLTRAYILRGLDATSPATYVQQVSQYSGIPRGITVVHGVALWYQSERITTGDSVPIGFARVDVTFERPASGFTGQQQQSGTLQLRGGSGLKQVVTELDREGNPITVQHTWPADSKAVYPDGSPKAGTTETQGGSIRVNVPTSDLSVVIFRATNAPGVFQRQIVGKVNATTWQGGAARTVLCTGAPFELVDEAQDPYIYRFTLNFAHDPETWDNDTTVRFIDASTGQPPADLVDGTGIKSIEYYEAVDFNAIINPQQQQEQD